LAYKTKGYIAFGCVADKNNMKSIFALFLTGFLFLSIATSAQQDSISNGAFEEWKLKEFLKCCGRNIDQPWYWGIAEQLTGINYNKFTFRCTDSANVHSGFASMELFSDTTYFNNLVLAPGIIAYGELSDSASTAITIGPVIKSTGFPLNGNPISFNFFMKTVHVRADTPYYSYVFTKWDSVGQKEDTLAYAPQVDIPDDPQNADQWISYSDSIHYLMPGTPDTARILFFGGRFGNPRLQGNATFLDDLTFGYLSTGLVSLGGGPVLQVYPNPASNLLTVKTGQYKPGNELLIFDATGRYIFKAAIESYSTLIDVSRLEAGEYFYRLSDKGNVALTQGKFSVIK
jgi:hypothetical protein